jgi:hypothetical protein
VPEDVQNKLSEAWKLVQEGRAWAMEKSEEVVM